jgi:TrmH family RNA methyltransferase
MTASFLLPCFSVSSWEEALKQLHEWNCTNLWAATMLEENGQVTSSAHYDISWGVGANALIIGSEGQGISEKIRQCLIGQDSLLEGKGCSVRAVHVPMEGDLESLNAAVCGSVILFEYMRQCREQ